MGAGWPPYGIDGQRKSLKNKKIFFRASEQTLKFPLNGIANL
jgi:hypothetical protein